MSEEPNVGIRFDKDKPRYELVPTDSLEELVKVYTKDAEHNWEKEMDWSHIFSNLLHHAWKFWKGEDYDEETGCHHMAMVAWNAMALCSYSLRKIGKDNRPL